MALLASLLRLWIVLFAVLWTSAALAVELPRGIYTYAGGVTPGAATMSAPTLEGFTAVLRWVDIEATEGVYDWTIPDAMVAQAEAFDKRIIMGARHGCTAGCDAADNLVPAWYSGPTFTCVSGEIGPATWKPEFQRVWRRFIRALVTRYRDEDRVLGFILSGVSSWKFAEMAPNTVCNVTATQTDRDNAITQGYTRQLLQDAMLDLARDITNLTVKPLRFVFARIIDESDGTASIAQTVEWINNPLNDRFGRVERMAASRNIANRSLGSHSTAADHPEVRVIFTLSSLSPSRGDPLGFWNQTALQPFEQELVDRGPLVAWQTDVPANGGPSDGPTMEESLDIGLHYNALWIEVQNIDVVNVEMQPTLACANTAMLARSGHCGH